MHTIGKSTKTIIIHVENHSFDSFDEHKPEISYVKGGPPTQTGGWALGQSGGHLSPGGECFALHGEPAEPAGGESRQEERPLGSLAATCHLEENASHHYPELMLRLSCCHHLFYDVGKSGPGIQWIPSSHRDGMHTIGKRINNHGIHVERFKLGAPL